MKKKVLSLLISSALIFSAFPITVTAVQKVDYFSSMTTEDKISQMIMTAHTVLILRNVWSMP